MSSLVSWECLCTPDLGDDFEIHDNLKNALHGKPKNGVFFINFRIELAKHN
jgi:hypothetical protein